MGRIFFVARTYSPNAASDIRYRSFLRGLESNSEITFVYFLPDGKNNKFIPQTHNISVLNKWENHYPSNRLLKHLFFYYQLIKFVLSLKKGDVVLVLACCEMLPILLLKKDIKLYYEISEHPEVSLCATKLFAPSVDRFISQCKKLSGLFVITQALKDYFIEKGVRSDAIHIINMTVDGSRFASLKKEATTRYIAYCGTASNNKDGVDQLIKSFAIVVKKYPDFFLYIIGRTPDKNQEFSNGALVKELGIEKNVVFTGAIPYYEVPQLLMNAEILALDRPDNQQAKYGFPTKLGEYLMTGNPVVITRVGDIPLFLKDKVSALIAEPDNIESFSNQLIWAIEHPIECRYIGKRGREVAELSFNGSIEGKKILRIIKSDV